MRTYAFLTLLILAILAACSKKEQTPYLLMISFDGFRHDYMQKYDTPNFDRLAEKGIVSEGLVPIFPANTFPNHYSIITGMYAGNHGLIANSFYDPEMDVFYSMRDRELCTG